MDDYWVLDRYEEGTAVLENIKSLEIAVVPGLKVPAGTVLIKDGDDYVPDFNETAERSKRIKSKFERLKKRQGM